MVDREDAHGRQAFLERGGLAVKGDASALEAASLSSARKSSNSSTTCRSQVIMSASPDLFRRTPLRRELLAFLADPVDGSDLVLENSVTSDSGLIQTGTLRSSAGRTYPIRNGIPRFVDDSLLGESVTSFGDEWNLFNYDRFKLNWLEHVVGNTFGSPDFFKDKVVVDAGAGSGAQSKWMAQAGARQVIALELSHSVDGIMQRNLQGVHNVDVVNAPSIIPPSKRGASTESCSVTT